MEEKDIERVLVTIMEDKFQFHPDKLTDIQRNESLLKPEIGFKAVDLFVLYMELEKAFNIKFDEKDKVYSKNTYSELIEFLLKTLEGYDEVAVM